MPPDGAAAQNEAPMLIIGHCRKNATLVICSGATALVFHTVYLGVIVSLFCYSDKVYLSAPSCFICEFQHIFVLLTSVDFTVYT